MTQLSLFGDHINILPSSGIVIELGPAPMWCEQCWEATYPVAHPDNYSQEWVCANIVRRECGCYDHDDEGTCGTCESCDSCCTCAYCDECFEMVPHDDVCSHCSHCLSCCTCFQCSRCDDRFTDAGCSECYRCSGCGCECESDEEECNCSDCRSERLPNRDTSVPDGFGKHLVGIEVEFVGSRSQVSDAIARARLVGWKVVADGSVGNGGELVSPALDWDDEDSHEQLHRAMDALRSVGAETDQSAGVHIHVDARDLTAAQVARVAVWAYDYEDQLYRVASSGWATIRPRGVGNYCKPIPQYMADKLANVETDNDLAKAWYGDCADNLSAYRRDHYNSTRYHAVNLHSWVYRGTVEFRVFNSSLSANRVSSYIAMCVAVVQSARIGKTPKPATRHALGDMVSGRTREEDSKRSMLNGIFPYLTVSAIRGLDSAWSDSRPQYLPVRRS